MEPDGPVERCVRLGLELREFYAQPPRTSRSVGGKATDTIPDRKVDHDRPARA